MGALTSQLYYIAPAVLLTADRPWIIVTTQSSSSIQNGQTTADLQMSTIP